MRDIFSSEYWLLGNLALMKLNGARLLFLLTHNVASQSSVHGHQMALVKNSSLSSWSWQDVQCGLYSNALFRGALGKLDLGKIKQGTTQRLPYWLPRTPQCIMWPNCTEAPGCHLTICGGFRCIGKGLVNAYSVMVRPESAFSPFVRKEGVYVFSCS